MEEYARSLIFVKMNQQREGKKVNQTFKAMQLLDKDKKFQKKTDINKNIWQNMTKLDKTR